MIHKLRYLARFLRTIIGLWRAGALLDIYWTQGSRFTLLVVMPDGRPLSLLPGTAMMRLREIRRYGHGE